MGLRKFKTTIREFLNEQQILSYQDVTQKQKIGDPYFDGIFSDENSEFVEEKIHIEKLRELNGFHNDVDDELEQTVSNFEDIGLDEDYYVSEKLMNKIVNGTKLNPIVVDEKYKILDGRHRLAAYSELWFYYGYDFPFDGKLEIYKRKETRKSINAFKQRMINENLDVNDYINQLNNNEYSKLSDNLYSDIEDEGWLEELEDFYNRKFNKNDFSFTTLNLTSKDKNGLIEFDGDVIEKFNDFDIKLKSMSEYPFNKLDLIDYDNGVVYIIRLDMELRKFKTTLREFLNEKAVYKQYVVFHSSNEYFNKFDLSKITNMGGDLYGYGFYFTNNITYSKQFGKYTYKCEITLSKPLDLTIKSTKETLLNLIKNIDIPKDELHSLIGLINNNSFTTAFRHIRKYISFEELSNMFDGVIGYADADGGGKEYVVYNPNNIKILSIEALS